MKKLFILSTVLFFYSFTVFSQTIQNDVIATTGGLDTTNHLQVSWTIGECIVDTYNNSDCIVSQGFQQPFYTISEVPELKKLQFKVKVYPNPAVNFINVMVDSKKLQDVYKIELLDINGKIIAQYLTLTNKIVRINLSNNSSGLLMLYITNLESKLHRTYKIVKIK